MKACFGLLCVLLGLLAAGTSHARPLRLVHADSRRISCMFSSTPACRIIVDYASGDIVLPGGSAHGMLRTRLYPRVEGRAAGHGTYAYLYRVMLDSVATANGRPCVHSVNVDFGPIHRLDYDGDGVPDDAFVITSNASGSVAPASAEMSGQAVTFTFRPAVCPGRRPGNGQTSFFFGMASDVAPAAARATVALTNATRQRVDVKLPGTPQPLPPGDTTICGDGSPNGVVRVDPSAPICRCLGDRALRNETHCGFFLPGLVGLLQVPSWVEPGKPFPLNWKIWLTGAGGARVMLVPPKGFRLVRVSGGGTRSGMFKPGPGEAWLVADGATGRAMATLRIRTPGMKTPMQVRIPVGVGKAR